MRQPVAHPHNGRVLPLLVDLVGFTGSGLSHTNRVGFRENLPERLDRLIGEQRMPPVAVAFPDCFTRLGGNQYINSTSLGAWEDFLLRELLPAVEQRFGCGGTGRRGVFGKSSGGYGAITHALRHSDVWSAAACHSGDMGFEVCYLPDMPAVLRTLAGSSPIITPTSTTGCRPRFLRCVVERVTFRNEKKSFRVLRVKARGQRDLITAFGQPGDGLGRRVRPGERPLGRCSAVSK